MILVYLAGPAVFMPQADAIQNFLRALCEAHGLQGLWPADGCDPALPKAQASQRIFDFNVSAIRRCRAVIADISPFRGPHCDVGTAVEIGIAHALGKPVFAYTDAVMPAAGGSAVPGTMSMRIWAEQTDTGWRDGNGMLVEDFDLPDNLMVAHAVRPQVSISPALALQRCAGYLRSVGEMA